MKVTFATTWDSKCGIAVYSRSLTSELKKNADLEIVSLDSPISPAKLAARLNRGEIAHVQHQYPFFGGMAFHKNTFRRMTSRVKAPLVVTIHELDLGDSDSRLSRTYKWWFNQYLFDNVEIDRIIVHSTEYRELLEDLGVEPDEIRVIPDGVPSVTWPSISSEEAKSKFGLDGCRVISIFGFTVRRKGYEIALDALRHLPEDVVLVIAGGQHSDDNTSYLSDLKERINASGLSKRVMITGYLSDSDVSTVMAATDIIVAPFTSVSNSASILRSMAYGKPVVASDLPFMREINDRQPCLSLFKPSDPVDMAEKVVELLSKESWLQAASDAVKSYAEVWSVERAAEETLNVYRELCER